MPIPETCLAASTLITMADKSQKRIDQLKVGDKILSYNFETKENEPDVLEQISSPVHSNMVRIELRGRTINCTPDHPFYSDGWVSVNPYRTELYYNDVDSAREIKTGMLLKGLNSSFEVVNIHRYKMKQNTHNISKLNKNKTYYANGILTSIENN